MKKENLGFIVVIDDDNEMRSLVTDHLMLEGFEVREFASSMAGVEFLKSNSPESLAVELVLTDLKMPHIDGIDVLRQVKISRPYLPVIIMTAFASVESAIDGLRQGAFDYLTKPFKLDELTLTVQRAIEFGRLQTTNKSLSAEVRRTWSIGEIVGKSAPMKAIFDLIERVAPATSNILISGESGTGKEVIARGIHQRSPRSNKPFIAINCTAIPETLLESELFGHAKGSFTGAIQRKKGLFEEAEGGTLFLDEIGDMDVSLQAKLLRVLQERKIKAVGDTQSKDIDVRVIAATHKDLKKSILNGQFREDLYYRLSVIPIVVPPLRHRPEDIPLLAEHFLKKYSSMNGNRVTGFSPAAVHQLMTMRWEGNVRELENMVERMVVLAAHSVIQESDLPAYESQPVEHFFGHATADNPTLEQLERRYIQLILAKTGGKKEKASQILGINRRTLYRKEREYGLVPFDPEQEEDMDN